MTGRVSGFIAGRCSDRWVVANQTRAAVIDGKIVPVLIASPGDVPERGDVERAIHEWNSANALPRRLAFLPRRWETDAVPRMGSTGGQQVINAQLVDDSDVVIAVFRDRLGSPTPEAVSGTAEEIDRVAKSAGHAHVYVSSHVARSADEKQAEALRGYLRNAEEQGLLGVFEDAADLRAKVDRALDLDADEFLGEKRWLSARSAPASGASGPPAPPRLEVLFARYGAEDGWIDVTQTLRERVSGGYLTMPVANEVLAGSGDPKFGVRKALEILVLEDDRSDLVRIAEGETVDLPRR
jgi:hypothetical protein